MIGHNVGLCKTEKLQSLRHGGKVDLSCYGLQFIIEMMSSLDYVKLMTGFLYSNKFEVNFYKCVSITICKHLEIYTKTISRLRLGDYKPIFTSPSAQ